MSMEKHFQLLTMDDGRRVVEMRLPEMLDSTEFDELNESLLSLIRTDPAAKWVLDLSHVAYMGSAMLGLMVNLRSQVKGGGGSLVLCCMPATLLQIFRTCCMERLFTIVKTRADALKAR